MAIILGRKPGGSGGGGGAPSGPAGGDLGGTYPNPTLSVAKEAELDGKIDASLYDANTVLAANSNDTPAAVTMGASTILARLAAGNIKAASVAEIQTLLNPELSYVQITADVNVTATVVGSADTIVTAGAVAFDGSTRVCIEFYSMGIVSPGGAASRALELWLFDGASNIGKIASDFTSGSDLQVVPCLTRRYLTPSNASHTYSIRGTVTAATGIVSAGNGTAGANSPAYIRITKVI